MQIIREVATTLVACALLSFPARLGTQDHDLAAETQADVPALHTFHTVIYTLWHTAWPKKDTTLLASLLPDIEQGAAAVADAKLPGILRDKQPAWSQGVRELRDIVEHYATAVKQENTQGLLDAAEQLHTQFERLVRVVHPALKELDQFHAVLYALYHHYVPDNNLTAIRASADDLRGAMDALNNATLPARLKQKAEAFSHARVRLAGSVEAFGRAVQTGNEGMIKSSLEILHTDYQRVERVFE
jgi:hypothetical protein